MAAKNRVRYLVEIDDKGTPTLRKVGDEFDHLEKKSGSVGKAFSTLRGHWIALTAAAIGMFAAFRGFVDAAGQAEMFETQLRAVSVSTEEASRSFKELLEFAARTPHMTQDVVAAFIQLKSVGLEPTIEDLKTIGDVAFLFGRNIGDVGSALISFEKEVLRRLGIEIDRVGAKAKIMSGDMRIETENTATAIRKGLLYVWEQRFGGAMKEAESTWRGQVALFKSGVWEMQKAIGDILLPALMKVIGVLTKIAYGIKAAAEWIKNLLGITTGLTEIEKLERRLLEINKEYNQMKHVHTRMRGIRAKGEELEIDNAIKMANLLSERSEIEEQLSVIKEKIANATTTILNNEIKVTDEKRKQAAFVESQYYFADHYRRIAEGPTIGLPGGISRWGVTPPTTEEERLLNVEEAMALADAQSAMNEILDAQIERYGMLGEVLSEYISIRQTEQILYQTIGASLQAAILGYSKFGLAVRQAAAETLAAIAAEAAVQAIFNLAKGFALLALQQHHLAAMAFKAAALYGAVAVMAGVAARAIAPAPTEAEGRGYEEARGARAGVTGLARAGEPEQYAQQVNVYIQGDVIGTEEWVENVLAPTIEKVTNRDTTIKIHYQ